MAPSCAIILTSEYSEGVIVSVAPVLIAVAVIMNRYLFPALSGAVCVHPFKNGLTVLPVLEVPKRIPLANVYVAGCVGTAGRVFVLPLLYKNTVAVLVPF